MQKIEINTWSAQYDNVNLLICENTSQLEILISDFDPSKTQSNSLGAELLGDLNQLEIRYPFDNGEYPTPDEYQYLQIIITGSESDKNQFASLNYGSNISWHIPVDFAKALFTFFLCYKNT